MHNSHHYDNAQVTSQGCNCSMKLSFLHCATFSVFETPGVPRTSDISSDMTVSFWSNMTSDHKKKSISSVHSGDGSQSSTRPRRRMSVVSFYWVLVDSMVNRLYYYNHLNQRPRNSLPRREGQKTNTHHFFNLPCSIHRSASWSP
jgi:hypothetical protein